MIAALFDVFDDQVNIVQASYGALSHLVWSTQVEDAWTLAPMLWTFTLVFAAVYGTVLHALFGQTVVDVDGGKMDKALEDVDKQYALGEKTGDVAAMTGDLQTRGTILVEMGKYDEAKDQFERALKMTQDSGLSQEIKDNAKLFQHYNLATVALGKKDYATAKAEAEEFRKGAEASKNPAQVRQSHQIAGMIALAEKDYDKAVAELGQTGQQNPQNLYRLCLAYQGKGDAAKAKEFCAKAAGFNSLPQLNYAFVRVKAQKMTAGAKA